MDNAKLSETCICDLDRFWLSRHFREWERGSNMTSLVLSVRTFIVSEDGPTAVEYAVMLALIVVVCLSAIQAVGTNATAKFTAVGDVLK